MGQDKLTLTSVVGITRLSLLASFKRENGIRRDNYLLAQLSLQSGVALSQCRTRSIELAVLDLAPLATLTESVVAAAIHWLALAEANADVALEPDVVARRELERIETGQQAVRLCVVLPFSEYTRVRCAAILIRHLVLVLDVVLHRLGNASTGESAVDCCRFK